MYERFEELRSLLGVSVAEICRQTGIKRSTMTEWKNGKFNLKDDKRKLLAKYFGVSLAVMDGEEDIPEGYPHRPLYEVAAGEGRVNGPYPSEFVDEKDEEELEEGYSWCRVCGDSMYPVLLDGDLVKVRHQTQTEPTDLTVIKVDGESATIKYVEIVSDGVILRAENKDVFEDRHYSVSEVMTLPITIIGKVVEMKRSF